LWITAVRSVGRGVPITISALYVTQTLGLPATGVGAGLTAAAAVAVGLGTWLGHLADRFGARGIYAAFLTLEAVGFAGLAAVENLAGFFAAALVIAVGDLGERGAQGAVIGGILPPDRRVHTRAVLRVVANVGIAAGSGLGGVVLLVDRPAWYVVALVGAGGALIAAAALTLRLPAVAAASGAQRARPWAVLADKPFVRFTLLNGVLNIHNAMLQVAVPIWIATHTDAPHWMVSVLFMVNVASVVLLQIRLARGRDDLWGATRAARRAGIALALACLLLALSDGVSDIVTIAVLLAATLAHALGEILESVSGWGVSFALAPPGRTGQYQGVHATGRGLGDLAGPLLLTTVAIAGGWAGWLVVAAVFLFAGLMTPLALRRPLAPAPITPPGPARPGPRARPPTDSAAAGRADRHAGRPGTGCGRRPGPSADSYADAPYAD
jgi:MFS family permease